MDVTGRVPMAGLLPVPRQLLAREPDWQFSLMLALEVVFLFVAIPALSAGGVDRSVVTLLQLVLAGTAVALLARSTLLRLALATSFGLTLLSHLLPGLLPHAITRLTSIGDGTVAARSPLASSLADAETVIGQLFPAILLSRLVGLHLSRSR